MIAEIRIEIGCKDTEKQVDFYTNFFEANIVNQLEYCDMFATFDPDGNGIIFMID